MLVHRNQRGLQVGGTDRPLVRASRSFRLLLTWAIVLAWVNLAAVMAVAQAPPDAANTPSAGEAQAETVVGDALVPPLMLRTDLREFRGKPLRSVVFREHGTTEDRPLQLQLVQLGEPFSAAVVRRAMDELLREGRYAGLAAHVEAQEDGVSVRLSGAIRRIVADVELFGGDIPHEEVLEVTALRQGVEITRRTLPETAEKVKRHFAERGFPKAEVGVSWVDTDDPARVVVHVRLQSGPARRIALRSFSAPKSPHADLRKVLDDYDVGVGDRADERALAEADVELAAELQRRGWFGAEVRHELSQQTTNSVILLVVADIGARYRVRVEGNRAFDSAELMSALDLAELEEPSSEVLRARLREYYEQRGFFDAVVVAEDRVGTDWTDRVLVVREGRPVRVVGRTYPCLRGHSSTEEVDEEIDGVLGEALPGGDDWVGPPPSEVMDESLGTRGGHRAEALSIEPWNTYTAEAYDRAINHLSDLYRAEGYLSALVGPVTVLRRACSPLSRPGHCQPLGVRAAPASICPTPSNPLPAEDPDLDDSLQCRPDPTKGLHCEPNVVLSIPIKLGPRTTLWNLEFSGNEQVIEDKLAEVADLKLGEPVSQVGLQQARRRILDHYADLGYAFASADVELQLSQDRTRGSAKFVISEREQVQITAIVVRGAERTSESLILGRLELIPGGVYRRNLVRQSEEQLATLGVFSSVTIGLEDPEVPAKRKVVIVHVAERLPQYVDVKPGFSTGEGARVTFEYGHRNLLGKAVQLTFRVQLGYLPGWLIFEDEVRRNFDELDLGDRLERRDTVTLEFPVGKRYRLAFDGVDARDNSRDFGITKRALIVTLTNRISRQLSLVAGSSFELNDARIFGDTQNLQEYLEANPGQVRLLNVPEGGSQAIAVRGGATFDLTDNPLGPTRGFFLSGEVEPVVAYLDEDNAAVQLEQCDVAGNDPDACEYKSRFLKSTGRVAGYIPFNDSGLSLALSLRAGVNYQLVDNSSTYPDRLFFMGGADSLRGFLQASLIPQDIAEQLQREDPDAPDQESRLTARKVVIRGGDFLFNPRAELRIPITKVLHTAVFLDSGNLWRDIDNVDLTVLRYTVGSGLRFVTPVGPLAFDYGVKLDRRFYESDLGAFHFSVGLF